MNALQTVVRDSSKLDRLCILTDILLRSCYTASTLPLERQKRVLYRPVQSTIQQRNFRTSQCLNKKGGKQSRDAGRETKDEAVVTADPFDFTTLETDIASTLERLKVDLSKLRTGGRFNHEVLENLRVQPDKSSNDRVKLNDLAQVIPKGRTIQILVGEKDHVKPVSSAIQGSDLSLTPQSDPTGQNPLLLEIKIPPPTAESRQLAVKEAVKAGDKASTGVRDARSKQHKAHRAMQLAKSAKPDDLTKAAKQMEKIVEKGQQDVKKTVDNAKKVLESG